jgi:hypothetical protein
VALERERQDGEVQGRSARSLADRGAAKARNLVGVGQRANTSSVRGRSSDADATHTCVPSWAQEMRTDGTPTHRGRDMMGVAAHGVASSSSASASTRRSARVRRPERGMPREVGGQGCADMRAR